MTRTTKAIHTTGILALLAAATFASPAHAVATRACDAAGRLILTDGAVRVIETRSGEVRACLGNRPSITMAFRDERDARFELGPLDVSGRWVAWALKFSGRERGTAIRACDLRQYRGLSNNIPTDGTVTAIDASPAGVAWAVDEPNPEGGYIGVADSGGVRAVAYGTQLRLDSLALSQLGVYWLEADQPRYQPLAGIGGLRDDVCPRRRV